jgi:hypothetical protein
VAGIAIAESISFDCGWPAEGGPIFPPDVWREFYILYGFQRDGKCQQSPPDS